MNKTLSVMLAAGFLVSGMVGQQRKLPLPLPPEQEARIGEIAKDYLLAHPRCWLRSARSCRLNSGRSSSRQ
ncbi:hypothetical protein K9U61_24690 [Pseudocitrobacter faecalis]